MTPGEKVRAADAQAPLEGPWRRVRLVLIQPPDDPHTAAFGELIETLFHAFRALGADVDLTSNDPLRGEGMNIVFAAHRLAFVAEPPSLPANSVIFNLEQLQHGAFRERAAYIGLLRSFGVWDFSQKNTALCQAIAGHDNVRRLRLGYMPQLTRIPDAPVKDIDVLFYGTVNERRRVVLDQLSGAGVGVEVLTGVYGAARDAFIARAKIVLNMHYYDDNIHELTRTSYLLANRKVVVSECDGETEIDDDIRRAIVPAAYGELVPRCLDLLSTERERAAIEARALAIFSRRSQADDLHATLIATPLPAPPMTSIAPASLGTSIAAPPSPNHPILFPRGKIDSV